MYLGNTRCFDFIQKIAPSKTSICRTETRAFKYLQQVQLR